MKPNLSIQTMRRTLLGTSLLFLPLFGDCQEGVHSGLKDSTKNNLRDILEDGELHISVRDYTMNTITRPGLPDSWANAFAGRMDFHSGSYYGLSFGIGGSFILNVASSDLAALNYATGKTPSFEKQLFDVQDPMGKDIGGVEELYVQYDIHKTRFTFGRFHVKTPLVNLHDGRMRPNAISGAYIEIKELKKVEFGLGWLVGSSPRSTNVWERMNGVIGLFGTGYNEDGSLSGYRHHLKTEGLGIFETVYHPIEKLEIGIWDYFIENILNTAMLQVEYERKALRLGLQYIRQDGMGNGGSTEEDKRYVKIGHQSNVLSERFGFQFKKFGFDLNHTWELNTGRFVFPRELGFDKLYANISRFRFEGMGNAHQMSVRFNYSPLKKLRIDHELGVLTHKHVNDFVFNKYNIPSIGQMNFSVKYTFGKFLEGLSTQFLYVYNFPMEDVSGNVKLEYDITNFHQWNLIINYKLEIKTKAIQKDAHQSE